MKQIWIKKEGGKWTGQSRDIMKELFDELPDGWHVLQATPKNTSYRPSRYKYYFDCVMRKILTDAGRFYRLVNPATGETREPRDTSELHTCMKAIYNPIVLVSEDNKTRVIAGTTTDLNDTEFINQFMVSIIADHSGPPYNLEIDDYDTWRQYKIEGR